MVVGWWGGWLPTHFKVKHQLQLRLSWAVTIIELLEIAVNGYNVMKESLRPKKTYTSILKSTVEELETWTDYKTFVH